MLVLGLGYLLGPSTAWAQGTSPAWIRHAWGNESGSSVRAHAIGTNQEHVYVTGRAGFGQGGVTFDATRLDSDSSSAFLLSYDEDGTQRWVRVGAFDGAGSTNENLYAGFLLTVGNDRIYTGEGPIYAFDSGQLTEGSVSVNTYDVAGDFLQTTVLGESPLEFYEWTGFAVGLGLDAQENAYLAGIYRDTLILASDTLVAFPLDDPEQIGDVFLVSLTPEGTLRWSQRVGGPRLDAIAAWVDPHGAFAVDGQGNTYLGGFFGQGAVFGEGQAGAITMAADGYALASFDRDGQVRWVYTAQSLGIGSNAGPVRLAVDASGHLLIDWAVESTGATNTVTVGDTTFTDPGFGGEFITKISPEGALLWARQLKSDGNEIITGILVDAHDHVYVAGFFDGRTLQLEDTLLSKQDLQVEREDGFVAHYDAEGRLQGVVHAGGPERQWISAVAVSPSGDLYVTGGFEGTLRLGAKTLSARGPAGTDLFVAKYDAATVTAAGPSPKAPDRFGFEPNYPNPFRSSTTLRFWLPVAGNAVLDVYDILGRKVTTLTSGTLPAGRHDVGWDAADLPSGLYVCRLRAGARQAHQTLVVAR